VKPKEKGDVALAKAISYYLCSGYEVCLPIGDKRDYDLIIEKDNILHKVQVKYAGFYKGKNKCLVGLRITGGNQSYHTAKKYASDAFDLLFVYTAKGQSYELKWPDVLARSELTIDTGKYDNYLLIDTIVLQG